MPVVVTDALCGAAPAGPVRKPLTRDECAAIEAAGLWEGRHFELVEGDLIDKMGKKRPHTNGLIVLHAWLIRVFGEQYVNPETSIDVSPEDNPTSEPEPDLIVLAKPSREFPEANPRPQDLRLVVEVSDSTLGSDLTTKAGLYARAGIVEYWVLDIQHRRLVVHREPRQGEYRLITVYSASESVAPLAAPGCEFRIPDAFPQ